MAWLALMVLPIEVCSPQVSTKHTFHDLARVIRLPERFKLTNLSISERRRTPMLLQLSQAQESSRNIVPVVAIVNNTVCSICGKIFSQSSSASRHKRIHTGERPYHCKRCHMSFQQKTHLLNHFRKHTGDKPYKCSECHKTFQYQHVAKRHLRVHNPTASRGFRCVHCARPFLDKANCDVHMKTMHQHQSHFECRACGMVFNLFNDLETHAKSHGPKPFICRKCGKSFARKQHFEQHLAIHNSTHRYPCFVCHFQFRERKQAKYHKVKIHGEKVWVCLGCEKIFLECQKGLREHMKIHYKQDGTCKLCGARNSSKFLKISDKIFHFKHFHEDRRFLLPNQSLEDYKPSATDDAICITKPNNLIRIGRPKGKPPRIRGIGELWTRYTNTLNTCVSESPAIDLVD
ncbi:hypothetical protein AAMO2058_001387000 [Amorphochlora amoebiformis]